MVALTAADSVLALRFAHTATSLSLFITACAEEHKGLTVNGDKTKEHYLLPVSIAIWETMVGKTFQYKFLTSYTS